MLKNKIRILWIELRILMARVKSLFNKKDPYSQINVYAKKFQKKLLKIPKKQNDEKDYLTYVISLPGSAQRFKNFTKSCKINGLLFERIEAIDCRVPGFSFDPFRQLIGERFYGSEMFPLGSIGCFLSHRKAWLKLLESPFDWALICEDDVEVLGPMPSTIHEFGFPSDANLVYANQRMAEPYLTKTRYMQYRDQNFVFTPVFDVVRTRFESRLGFDVVGAEAYFLSKVGAERLLKAYEVVRYNYNNDLFMLIHSLTTPERGKIDQLADRALLIPLKSIPEKLLQAYVIIPPIFSLSGTPTAVEMLNPKMQKRRIDL